MICTVDKIALTIREVLTRYACMFPSKCAADERMMGGVMIPASMARECWKPSSIARSTGMRALRPKNGAARRSFFMKGRFGLKRNP